MIRGLSELLHERGLVKTAPLVALNGTHLGIDLGELARALLAAHQEPLTAAIGGLPLGLCARLSSHIETLIRMHIRPVFVIDGFAPLKSHPPFAHDGRPADLAHAWSLYEADQIDAAAQAFALATSIPRSDLIRPLLKTLHVRNVPFLTAPFLASSQLAYMERHPKGFVHSMYGNEMLLMFDGVERVITSIDLDAKSFTFVSKAAVLSELKCNADDFLDACILSGFEHCPTFPPLLDGSVTLRGPGPGDGSAPSPSSGTVNPLTVVQLVKQHRGGFATIAALGGPPRPPNAQYTDAFCRARALIKFSLVTADDGKVMPLPLAISAAQNKLRGTNGSSAGSGSTPPVIRLGNGVLSGQKAGGAPEIPSDLHEVFFYRLPDDLYSYLGRGLIGTQVYQTLLSGQCVEQEPLEGGSLPEYQSFVRDTLTETPHSPRAMSLALAASHLNEFWKARPITAVYWFDPSHAHEVQWKSNETQTMLACVSTWNVPGSTISRALTEQQYGRIDLLLCLGATRTPEGAKSTITPPTATQPFLERKDEVAVNTRWRLLELRGFLNHEHLHTAFGRALYRAVRYVHVNDPLQEPLYIALELIRAGVLHGRFFNNDTAVFSGGPSLECIEGVEDTAKEDNRSLLLVMRALSLVPMTLLPQPWDAPLSRELFAFHAFASALTRSLRALGETLACEMLLSGTAKCKDDEAIMLIALSLPFQTVSNTGLGVIAKCYVEGLLIYLGTPADRAEAEELDEAKTTLVTMLQQNFKEIRDVKLELTRGFRFWSALVLAVRLLGQEGALEPSLVAEFEAADKWLAPMMIK